MQLTSGKLLHGNTYRIERTLGQGSFGITYLATHTSLDRKVAIKEFFMKELNSRGEDGSITGMSDGSLSYNYGQKFKKEAMNLSQLDHPNIVRVTDSFEENGTYYYVMDYIEGENLNDYLKHTSISQDEAVIIITAVAKALQYMHDEKNILHLDLKPGNIMRRSNDGHIFLIDFGLSKHYSSTGQPETSTTIGLGTPGYAPIEQSNQAKSGEFRPTIDVYALGATLFKLLTRETPPPASDIVSDDELIEGKLRANGITGNIINVVVNAMLPNVKKRTQTISAFLWMLTATPTEGNTSPSSQSKVQDEETIIARTSTVKGEETIVSPTINELKEKEKDKKQENAPVENNQSNFVDKFSRVIGRISMPIFIIATIMLSYDIYDFSSNNSIILIYYQYYQMALTLINFLMFLAVGLSVKGKKYITYSILTLLGVVVFEVALIILDIAINTGVIVEEFISPFNDITKMEIIGSLFLLVAFVYGIIHTKTNRFIYVNICLLAPYIILIIAHTTVYSWTLYLLMRIANLIPCIIYWANPKYRASISELSSSN